MSDLGLHVKSFKITFLNFSLNLEFVTRNEFESMNNDFYKEYEKRIDNEKGLSGLYSLSRL